VESEVFSETTEASRKKRTQTGNSKFVPPPQTRNSHSIAASLQCCLDSYAVCMLAEKQVSGFKHKLGSGVTLLLWHLYIFVNTSRHHVIQQLTGPGRKYFHFFMLLIVLIKVFLYTYI
jgi:hypothetical protein